MKLTEKQKRFIDHFISTGSQVEAARLAGYKKPNIQGAQNYAKLRHLIEERLASLESERIADATEVLQYLTSVIREEVDEEVVVVEGCGDGVSESKIVRKSVGVKDRNKAAELLGKRYGLFADKLELSGKLPLQVVIEDDYGDDDPGDGQMEPGVPGG